LRILTFAAASRQRHHHPRLEEVGARKLAGFSIVDAPIDAMGNTFHL